VAADDELAPAPAPAPALAHTHTLHPSPSRTTMRPRQSVHVATTSAALQRHAAVMSRAAETGRLHLSPIKSSGEAEQWTQLFRAAGAGATARSGGGAGPGVSAAAAGAMAAHAEWPVWVQAKMSQFEDLRRAVARAVMGGEAEAHRMHH
jgi:hypothetical protein